MKYKITKIYSIADYSVGIDFGIHTYLTLSDGKRCNCPHFFSDFKEEELTDKKKKKLRRKQSTWHKKLAAELCKRYNYIFLEDLSLRVIKKWFPKQMRDCNHQKFLRILDKTAQETGTVVHKIDRYYPSSQLCTCGYRNRDLTLKIRKWTCPICHQKHDRDLLAANNILRKGLEEIGMSNT